LAGKGAPDGRRRCREKGEQWRGERERKGEVVAAGEENSPRTTASFSGAEMGSLPVSISFGAYFP
jgi:hypothetical protein